MFYNKNQMMTAEEEKLIKMNVDLFDLHGDKHQKFIEIWNVTKQTMEEKLKYQKSLSEILLRCCSFLTYLYFNREIGEEIKTNQMEKFMKIEKTKSNDNNGNGTNLFDLRNLKTNQQRLLNLHDFFKFLKKIVRQNYDNTHGFELSSEIIKDFSFSNILYQKCEEFMNLFFDNHSPYFQNLKKLIWTCYIYSRAKLINHSRNLLECLPMLISVMSIFLLDIEDQRFSQSFSTLIESEVNAIIAQNNFNKVDHYEKLVREKKKDFIIDILYKKAGQRTEDIPQINLQVIENIRNFPELKKFYLHDLSKNMEGNVLKNFDLSDDIMINMTEIFKIEYEKFLKFKFFDERIFLMEKDHSDCSPIKLTPFKRQKILNLDFNIKKPTAFKTLDFDSLKRNTSSANNALGEQIEAETKNTNNFNNFSSSNTNMTNIFRGLDVKELTQKLNSNVEMTPCSKVMYMDRWVKEYIKDFDIEKLIKYENLCNSALRDSADEIINNQIDVNFVLTNNLEKIQRLFSSYKVRVLTQIQEIKTLIFKIICGLIKRDERKFKADFISRILFNENFLKSALIVGVEIVLFIENVEEISFYKLADVLELDLYEFWKIINPFLNFDLTIPSDIRLHFNEIELQLMSFMIWKKSSKNFKEELTVFLKDYAYFLQDKDLKEIEDIEFNNQSLFVYQDQNIFVQNNIIELMSPSSTAENSSTSLNYSNSINLMSYKSIKPIYIFLRRILNYSIFLNKKITDNLRLNRETAKECEYLLKNIMNNKNYIEILFNRHIDQIIVCSIIAVMKNNKQYNDKDGENAILDAYHKSKPDDYANMSKSLFFNIKSTQDSTAKTMKITEYYEEIFAKRLNSLINKLKAEEDDDHNLLSRKRRKLSVPDSEIRKLQFEDETAFESNTIMYEPLSKTIFNKNRQNPRIGESPSMKNPYLSLRCSPILGRYLSPSVNHRTPRTLRVRDAYTDSSYNEVITFSNNSSSLISSSGNNHYKNKLKSFLSSASKPNNGGALIKHQISELSDSNGKNSSNENDNSKSEVNEFSLGLNMSLNNSQTTPEFNKTKFN